MALSGNIARLQQFKARLRDFPRTLAAGVAERAAPSLTGLARDAYGSGRTVYGEARPTGVDGRALTLRASGATERDVKFEAVGTIVRCKLGPRWSRFLIGKYSILPNGALPAEWRKRLGEIVSDAEARL